MTFKNYDELVKSVENGKGLVTVRMGDLRDAHGAGKLGVNVVANISDELDGRGLGHFPDPLPQNQWEHARVFQRSTSIGRVIKAVLTTDNKSDEVLRSVASNNGQEVIKKIRELVCD